MSVQSAAATAPETPLLWMVRARNAAPPKPPYLAGMAVTPESIFGDDCWSYPIEWISRNQRNRRFLDFFARAKIGTGTYSLRPGRDDRLLLQLKQVMWAALSHREVLVALPGRKKTRFLKPGGAHGALANYRRLFVGLAAAGCNCLSEVDGLMLNEAMRLLDPSSYMFESLAWAFEDVSTICKAGLVENGLRLSNFRFESEDTIADLTAPTGFQPFSDDEVAALVKTSLDYVGSADAIIEAIEDIQGGEDTFKVFLRMQGTLPCGERLTLARWRMTGPVETLTRLLHAAGGNLLCFQAGLRVSEMLSVEDGFVTSENGEAAFDVKRLRMEFVTYKTVLSFGGEKRRIAAHPIIAEVASILERLKRVLDTGGDHLFVPAGEDEPYITNVYNYVLQTFCDLHGIEISISSHRWRKTVAAIAIRVLTGGALHLKTLFGHKGLAMTARYILASPFIREAVRDLTLDVYRKRGEALFTSLSALGGPGLGGRQGKHLEERFSALVSSDVTQADLRRTLDGFVDEMIRQEVYPIPVMPGVLCTKPRLAVGACARTSGDRMADPARCSASCSFQVQEANRLPVARWAVARMAREWENWSPLQQNYWVAQCSDLMIAWPELKIELKHEIAAWPALADAIGGSDG